MGSLFSSGLKGDQRILLLGLDGAGKTTLWQRLKYGASLEPEKIIPTMGFECNTIKHGKITLQMWDTAGQQKLREMWHHHLNDTDCLIYVVDSSDEERLEESKEALHVVMKTDQLSDALLLVFANKCDLDGAKSKDDVTKALALDEFKQEWKVFESNSKTGSNLDDGLDWMIESLKIAQKRKKAKAKQDKIDAKHKRKLEAKKAKNMKKKKDSASEYESE